MDLYQKFKADSGISNEEIIKNLINSHMISESKQDNYNGMMYYRSKNTAINSRSDTNYVKNNKVANGFFKKLVDQKVNYLVGKDVTIDNNVITNILSPNDFLKELSRDASKTGIGWLHLYVDSRGNLSYRLVDNIEIIPIWDTEFEEELQQIIRYYQVEVVSDKGLVYRNKVEVWDTEKVTYYIEDEDGNYYFDTLLVANPVWHFNTSYKVLGRESKVERFGWGAVPFIPLFNNEDYLSDLDIIKNQIDLYDIVESDFANNLEHFQDSIIVLKDKSYQDYEQFMDILKKYKILPVDETGDASYLKLDIPVEARKELLAMLRDNIYEFGQGVDSRAVGDGNITNIVIQARYSDLDLKCDDFKRQVLKFLYKLFDYIESFRMKTSWKPNMMLKIKRPNITFNKSMIFNMSETIENCVKSLGIVSRKTLTSNHPWVDDVNKELEEIDKDEVILNDPDGTEGEGINTI